MAIDIEVRTLDNGHLLTNATHEAFLKENSIETFDDLWKLKGEPVKKKLAERGTEKALLTFEGKNVETYVKRYLPLPFKEYFKAITSLRPFFPSGAIHEWESILAFHRKGIPTMEPIAAGRDDSGRSAVLTLGIRDYVRASELLPELQRRDAKDERRRLILAIAELTGRMHAAEFAHQDFYLVHLFVKRTGEDGKEFQVLPIDLQRIVMGARFGRRWRVKDLGQLLHSAWDCTTPADRLVFWKRYTEIAGTEMYGDKALLKAILGKAKAIRKRSIRKKKRNGTTET